MNSGRRFVQATPVSISNTEGICCANAESYLWLVLVLLRRFPHKSCDTEDLYQQGCLGLMKAISRYDPSYGTSFRAYAASMIIGEMRMLSRISAPIHVPRTDREIRIRLKRAINLLTGQLFRSPTIDELAMLMKMEPTDLAMLMEEVSVISADTETESGSDMWEYLPASDQWVNMIELRDIIQHLPVQDQQLLHYRYFEGLSQTETAKRLMMTQIQVSRRERVLQKILYDEWQHASE